MTNENYMKMSNEELLLEVKKLSSSLTWQQKKLKTENLELWHEVVKRTNFLKDDIDLSARLYCLEHNISERPLCESCAKNPVSWLSKKRKFARYCSARCREDNPET